METVLITGGTGMVGKHLTRLLIQNGYRVCWLSRASGESVVDGHTVGIFRWNPESQVIDEKAIVSADHIVHLAGAGVADQRWTKKRKQEIHDSRTKSSALIVKALTEIPNSVQTVVSASAIGWYGPDRQEVPAPFTEDMPHYDDFLGNTCSAWEAGISPVAALHKRLVKLRIGIVLSNKGGAVAEFKKPLMAGIAPIFGSGKQIVSWIHVDDLCSLFLYAIQNKAITGVYNAVAPHPVSSRNLIVSLANSMNKPWALRIPVFAFLLRFILGEMSIEILKSATVSSNKIAATGFRFQYPVIDDALRNL